MQNRAVAYASLAAALILVILVLLFAVPGATRGGAAGRYQLVRANDSNIFLVDTATGRCWRKFVDATGGPTQWQEESPDVKAAAAPIRPADPANYYQFQKH